MNLKVLKRDPSTDVSLLILRNFQESFFAEYFLASTSHMMLLFFPFTDQRSLQSKINLFGGAVVN